MADRLKMDKLRFLRLLKIIIALSIIIYICNFNFLIIPNGSLRRIRTTSSAKFIFRGNHEIWDLVGFLPKEEEEKLKKGLGYPSGYRIKFEDLVSGPGIARYAQFYLKQIGDESLFNEFMENGSLTGKSVADAFNKGNAEQRKVAEEIFYEIGRYLGMGIKALVLGEGEKADVEWSKEDWNYWSKVRQIILGGFIPEAGEEAEVLIKSAEEFLRQNGLDYIKIKRAPLRGKEAGILGTVAYVVSKRKFPLEETEKSGIGILAVDFGRTHIGTGIVLIDPASGNLIGDLNDSIVYKDDTKVEVWIDDPKGGTLEDRKKIVNQIVEEIIKAINYAQTHNVPIARDIGICSPGLLDEEGYFIGGVNYLPFWDKESGFHLPSAIKTELQLRGYTGYKIHILNDGNAQVLGNVKYGSASYKPGIIGYIGPGSGLGGGLVEVIMGGN